MWVLVQEDFRCVGTKRLEVVGTGTGRLEVCGYC